MKFGVTTIRTHRFILYSMKDSIFFKGNANFDKIRYLACEPFEI